MDRDGEDKPVLHFKAAAVQRQEMPPPADLVQRYREILRLK